jgi:hypothetical protein
MTTRRTEEKRARSRRQESGTATIVLGDPNVSRTGFRPELPPIEGGEARFSLASDTGATDGKDIKEAASDAWAKHKTAILVGAAALVLIAIVRKR